jgi:putative tricarboxylic transport membrane protein
MTSERSLRHSEAALGGFLVALGLFIVFETAQMTVAATHAAIGPKLFPNLVAAGLVVVGAVVLREAGLGRIAHRGGFELDWGPPTLIAAGLIAQLLLIERLGWILATTILFVAVARAFTSRRPLLDAMIGLALTSLCLIVFNWGLGLTLPTGSVLEMLMGGSSPAP